MNQSVRDYVASVVLRYPQDGKDVLEFGSFDVNGTVRDLFDSANSYLGVDKRAGPGVDLVQDAHRYWQGRTYDTVVCLEVLEHDPDPALMVCSALDNLKPGGLFIVTARGIGYGLHDEPEDYFRFTHHGIRLLMEQAGFEVIEVIDHTRSMGVFGCAIK